MAGALIRSSFVHRSDAPPVARSLQWRFNRSAPTLHRLRCRRPSGRTPIPYISAPALHIILELVRVQILDDVLDLRSEEHTSELQSRGHLVCRLLLAKKKT